MWSNLVSQYFRKVLAMSWSDIFLNSTSELPV